MNSFMDKLKILFIFSLLFLIGCNSSILDDPSVTILYRITEESYVNLIVENSYDTQIATLVDEKQSAGYYQVSFDASNLAEGIYFYTLELTGESGDYSKTTKHLLLIK
jgi:hypothetical protein